MSRAVFLRCVSLLALSWPTVGRAEVLFQNTGNKTGWQSIFTQKAGTIEEVTSPVYKGTTAVKATQTYQTSDGLNYHSEIIHRMAELVGQDLYYGQAVYLPPDWVFHSQNVTFQQWAPENPEAPWILMYVQNDKIRLGGRGQGGDTDVGPITGLRGTWMRIVTRIHMANPGIFEVWINDKKYYSRTGNLRSMGPSLRWSSGIYCTRWDTETPTGPHVLSIFHDSLRVATTFDEANPANWSDGDAPASDGGVDDAAPVAADADEPPAADAGAPVAADIGVVGGSGGAGGTGGASGETGGGAAGGADTGGAGGEAPTGTPSRASHAGGCAIAPGGGDSFLLVVLGLLLISGARPRATRRRRPADPSAGRCARLRALSSGRSSPARPGR
jgi:hypothetical protein